MVYVMIVTILAAGVWSHIKMLAAQARIAYEVAHQQALAKLEEQRGAVTQAQAEHVMSVIADLPKMESL